MGEYIKSQPLATSAANGDWFVFDTATQTFRITRANLLGFIEAAVAANTNNIDDNTTDIATNTANIAANAADLAALGLEWVSINVNNADLLTLFSNPKTLFALPPSTSIDILDASFYFRYNTAAYATGGNLIITSGGATIGEIEDTIYTGGSNAYGKLLGVVPATLTTWTDIFLTTTTSNPTTGDGSLTINILYRRIS